jgi:hypothetical protein
VVFRGDIEVEEPWEAGRVERSMIQPQMRKTDNEIQHICTQFAKKSTK